MSISRMHFQGVADAFNAVSETLGEIDPYQAHGECAELVADFFGTCNPRFDREKFLLACGHDLRVRMEKGEA